MKLFTIGHGNLEVGQLIELLRLNEVAWIGDVRSVPYSRRFPQFSRSELTRALKEAEIKYLFLGDTLGGKPREGESEGDWRQGRINYELVYTLSRTERWAEGIAYLAGVVKAMAEQGETGSLLCSETDPNNCHRSLIAFDLESALPTASVIHLGHDSSVREAKFQKTLFSVSDERADYH